LIIEITACSKLLAFSNPNAILPLEHPVGDRMAEKQDTDEGFAGRYSVRRGETGRGNVAGTVKAIITGAAITGTGIGSGIAVAKALAVPDKTASGQPMPPADGWSR
jgi:hypothetical protein